MEVQTVIEDAWTLGKQVRRLCQHYLTHFNSRTQVRAPATNIRLFIRSLFSAKSLETADIATKRLFPSPHETQSLVPTEIN